MNKNILIIAGSGFLGQALLRAFSKLSGVSLACASRTNPAMEGVTFHPFDLLADPEEKLREIVSQYDIIINCSGQITNPINTCFRLNTEGISKITAAVKATGKFLLHFSTATVYGSCDYADEQTVVNPETSYSSAKAFAEFVVTDTLEDHCIIRLSNLYAEEQPKGVFSYLKRSFFSDRQLQFNNDGYMIRNYLHIDDCAEIVVQLLNSGKARGTFNLVGPDQYTLRQLVELAENISGSRFTVSYTDVASWDNIKTISGERLGNAIPVVYKRSIQTSFKNILQKAAE